MEGSTSNRMSNAFSRILIVKDLKFWLVKNRETPTEQTYRRWKFGTAQNKNAGFRTGISFGV